MVRKQHTYFFFEIIMSSISKAVSSFWCIFMQSISENYRSDAKIWVLHFPMVKPRILVILICNIAVYYAISLIIILTPVGVEYTITTLVLPHLGTNLVYKKVVNFVKNTKGILGSSNIAVKNVQFRYYTVATGIPETARVFSGSRVTGFFGSCLVCNLHNWYKIQYAMEKKIRFHFILGQYKLSPKVEQNVNLRWDFLLERHIIMSGTYAYLLPL